MVLVQIIKEIQTIISWRTNIQITVVIMLLSYLFRSANLSIIVYILTVSTCFGFTYRIPPLEFKVL